MTKKQIQKIVDKYNSCFYNVEENKIECADSKERDAIQKELGLDDSHVGGSEVDGYYIWDVLKEEVEAPKYADDLEIEIANKLEKAFPQSKGVHDNATNIVMDIVDYYQTYYDEGKTQDEIRAKLIAKLPEYGVTHMGMAGRIIDLVIKEFGIDKWDWSEGHPTESLKEEKEYLSDKVTKVLDDYGILYGEVLENGDGSVNIVGIDEDEWDEVVDAIKAELGLDVLVPDSDHDELDNELIVRESLKEDKEEKLELETFENKMDFLAKDEQEAIDGYDKVIAMLDSEQDAFVIEQLTKIKVEEEAHKKYLEDVKTNKELEYTEPLEQEDEKEEGGDSRISKKMLNDMNLDVDAIEQEIKEGKTSAQRYNDMLHKTFEMAKKANLAMKDFLIKKGVSEEEAEKLYQDTGLHGSPLQQKLIDMGLKDEFFSKYDYSKGVMKEDKHEEEHIEYVCVDANFDEHEWFDSEKEAIEYAESHDEINEVIELHYTIDKDGYENFLSDREKTVWLKDIDEGCKKDLKEYNLPKDAKPYKTCGDKEYYIATFDDIDRAMMGNKATHTVVTKKVGGDFDLGSASGLDFDSEEKAKAWIDQACSLKEDVSDEVASKLQALYDEGNVYFDLAKDKDGDDFLIVDGWEDVRKIQKALKPDFEPKDEYDTSVLDELFDNGYQWGFRDEYSTCDRCGKVIRTEADSYSWVPDFFVDYDNGEIICGDCVRENPKEYLETLYNNPEKANTILSAQDLIDNGFEKIDGDYEDGWYDKHDSPEEILNKALEAHPNGVFIFHISGQGQFATQFELWGADLDLDESKKKDIKEGENFEKVTDHKVEIHHENGDVDTKFFDTHEEACDAYDKASIGGDIVKVCRYSADECEEVKELEESLKESYKDNDLIEFEDDAPMTFGEIVDMMYDEIKDGALDDESYTCKLSDEELEDLAIQYAHEYIKDRKGHKAKKEAKR